VRRIEATVATRNALEGCSVVFACVRFSVFVLGHRWGARRGLHHVMGGSMYVIWRLCQFENVRSLAQLASSKARPMPSARCHEVCDRRRQIAPRSAGVARTVEAESKWIACGIEGH